mgnify:CR=1 FL=1
MAYSSACFSTANVIETDMQQVEDNFDALRDHFANSTAPTSPDAGQLWYDTTAYIVKIRYNSSWVNVWDMANQRVASGQVKTDSLAVGALSTDSTGRAKMAPGYITSSHVDSIDVTKITNLNKNFILGTIGSSVYLYIPNSGASKLKCVVSGYGAPPNAYALDFSVTCGTCTVQMGQLTTDYVVTSTYIDVTAFLGTVQKFNIASTIVAGSAAVSLCQLYMTT